MSVYLIAPSPQGAVPQPAFATWQDAFASSDIDRIVEIGTGLTQAQATVGPGGVDPSVRQCQTAWIAHNPETAFIYDALAWVARSLNGQFYDFDLFGFVEDLQFTTYGPGGDHYDWHVDKGQPGQAPRKLSMTLQLSDPMDYAGGDLEIWGENLPTPVTKRKGLIAAFPSYTMHRVTPVTAGVRHSLVVWLSGPRFR